jgi:hypothetical protein
MSLPRATILVTAAVAIVTACGGSTSSTSGSPATSDAGGTAGSSCADLGSAAQKDVAAVVEAHRSCTQASDCMNVELSASCFDSCTRALRKDAAADLKAAQDKADQTQCAQFTGQGCKVTVPPCEPPMPPMCVSGMCSS